jgi:hypothetical protein
MDLSKFISMLQSQSLWLSRTDCLGDPLEGSVPRPRYVAEQINRDAGDQQLSDWRRKMLTTTYVSCWHANQGESAAMWSLYAKSNESICVQTTFKKLASPLPQTFLGGKVKYIDFETEDLPSMNMLQPIMHKRRSFAHEQEFRLVGWTLAADDGADQLRSLAGPTGARWPLDPNLYVEKVHVSPTAPEWFHDVVKETAKDYKLAAPVQQSSLAQSPLY